MRAPTSRKAGAATVWDGSITIADRTNPRKSCPTACLEYMIALRDVAGREQATLCLLCDNAVSRTQWRVIFERGDA